MFSLDLEKITDEGIPYEKFLDGIKSPDTKRHYVNKIAKFLGEIPDRIYEELGCEAPGGTVESRAECFVKLCRKNPRASTNIIAEYIKHFNEWVNDGRLSPNTIPNYVKPIRVLLDTNDVPIHWKRLRLLYPRKRNSQDRAYSREELQKMMMVARDITDKVILAMFSSAGFRLESWDYFTWSDVTFFKKEDGSFRGAALLVYRGDPESYWTFITPEACRYLSQYREKWRKDLGAYPEQNQPLIKVTDRLELKRLEQKGVRKRVENMAKEAGLRPPLPPGQNRYPVKLDHGFRKYFNTMLRRAKVNYLDKEDMMGHKVGLEKNYERYIEEDFERFPEYQKAIPLLTISDTERLRAELDESRRTTRKGQKRKSAENTKMRNEFRELFDLAEKLKDAGVLEMIKKIQKCRTCDEAYLGGQCPRCG